MHSAELAILDWIQTHLRCEFLDMADAMDQLDGKPWGNLDFAGSSVGAVKGARRHGAAVAFGLTLV